MKARLFDRLVLAFYLIINLSGLLLLGIWFSGILDFLQLQSLTPEAIVTLRWPLFGVWLFWLAMTVYLMLAPNKTPPASVQLLTGSDFSLRITVSALEQLAGQYAKGYNEIERARFVFLPARRGGISLHIRVAFKENTILTELCPRLQVGVAEHLQLCAGLTLTDVNVTIESNQTKAISQRVR